MYRHAACFAILILSASAGCSEHSSGDSVASPGVGNSAKTQVPADRGAQIYSGNCIACHQQDARGVPGVYPSLLGSTVLLGDPKDLTQWVILGIRPPSLPPGRYPTAMTRFGWMKPRDAAALFTFLRSHFGNSASPVDEATVTQALGQ